jgi:hypothetical protein
MIIVSSQIGQLGNGLFLFAHLLAHSIEKKRVLWNPAFYRYTAFFKATKDRLLPGYPLRGLRMAHPYWLREFLYRCVRRFSGSHKVNKCSMPLFKVIDITDSHDAVGMNFDLGGREFDGLYENSPVLVIKGWLFRDLNSLRKNGDVVRRYFEPLDQYSEAVNCLIQAARTDCDILVGVHIRQGDYREYCEGRYYFDVADYVAIMLKIRGLWGDQRVKFLICSDQIQDESRFAMVPHIMGSHAVVEDLYAFSECDYVFGPPSTFTQWASFYGKVPLCSIIKKNQAIALDQFVIWEG